MKKSVYYVIGGPYVSDQAGLNRGPLILIVFHCYFVSTFCEDRINTFLSDSEDSDVKPTLKRGHYAVETLEVRSKIGRFATCNGNAISVRAFPGVTESTV